MPAPTTWSRAARQAPAASARALLTPGWTTNDPPLVYASDDNVGIRRMRVLVDGGEARVLRSEGTLPFELGYSRPAGVCFG